MYNITLITLMLFANILCFSCTVPIDGDDSVELVPDASGNIDPSSVTTESFVDARDGTKYLSIKIGEQVWMAENLSYVVENSFVSNDETIATHAGRYYTWYQVMDGATGGDSDAIQGICPSGWHIPSIREFVVLEFSTGVIFDDNANTPILEHLWDWNSLEEETALEYAAVAMFNVQLASSEGWPEGSFSNNGYLFSAFPTGYFDAAGIFSETNYSGNQFASFWSVSGDVVFEDGGDSYSSIFTVEGRKSYLGYTGSSHYGNLRCIKD